MRNTRVKVPREFLIEKIKEKLAKEEAEYEATKTTFESAMTAQSKAVAKELSDLAKAIEKDPTNASVYIKNIEHYWRGDRIMISLKTKVTVNPPDDREIRYLQKTIRVLEAATDDTISVSTFDEYYAYL